MAELSASADVALQLLSLGCKITKINFRAIHPKSSNQCCICQPCSAQTCGDHSTLNMFVKFSTAKRRIVPSFFVSVARLLNQNNCSYLLRIFSQV